MNGSTDSKTFPKQNHAEKSINKTKIVNIYSEHHRPNYQSSDNKWEIRQRTLEEEKLFNNVSKSEKQRDFVKSQEENNTEKGQNPITMKNNELIPTV